MDGVSVIDPLDVVRLLAGSSAVGVVAYQLSKALGTAWVERSKRKTLLAVMDQLIERERGLGQAGPQLEVVRLPSDQLDLRSRDSGLEAKQDASLRSSDRDSRG